MKLKGWPFLQNSHSLGLGWKLRICISSKFPVDVDTGSSGPTPGKQCPKGKSAGTTRRGLNVGLATKEESQRSKWLGGSRRN